MEDARLIEIKLHQLLADEASHHGCFIAEALGGGDSLASFAKKRKRKGRRLFNLLQETPLQNTATRRQKTTKGSSSALQRCITGGLGRVHLR